MYARPLALLFVIDDECAEKKSSGGDGLNDPTNRLLDRSSVGIFRKVEYTFFLYSLSSAKEGSKNHLHGTKVTSEDEVVFLSLPCLLASQREGEGKCPKGNGNIGEQGKKRNPEMETHFSSSPHFRNHQFPFPKRIPKLLLFQSEECHLP